MYKHTCAWVGIPIVIELWQCCHAIMCNHTLNHSNVILSFSLSTHTHAVHFYVFPLLFPLSLSSLCVFLFSVQMQEAEVQFLREQNELQIKRAKDLSNIEVYNYHLCCHCTFNINYITCTCMYYCIIMCMSIYSNRCLSSVHWLVLWVNKLYLVLLKLDQNQRYTLIQSVMYMYVCDTKLRLLC